MNETEIRKIINEDPWRMKILRAVYSLDLPDWWIGAGFVRNKVWDVLHGYTEMTPLNDIDVIYFDQSDLSEDTEKKYEEKLASLLPELPWSVKNQARMAAVRGDGPYISASEGLSKWVETAMCIGVRLKDIDHLELTAPHGIDDLIRLYLRPTKSFKDKIQVFNERIHKKNWLTL